MIQLLLQRVKLQEQMVVWSKLPKLKLVKNASEIISREVPERLEKTAETNNILTADKADMGAKLFSSVAVVQTAWATIMQRRIHGLAV